MNVINVTFNGANYNNFAFTGDFDHGIINPGESRTIKVVFKPVPMAAPDNGSRTARVDIISNASSSPDSVALSGTGT